MISEKPILKALAGHFPLSAPAGLSTDSRILLTPPTSMRQIGQSGRLRDVIERRLTSAASNARLKVFGFDTFGTRIWSSSHLILILIGETKFLRLAEDLHKKFMHPLPGGVDIVPAPRSGIALDQTRLCQVVNCGFDGLEQAVTLKGDSSVCLSKVRVSNGPYIKDLHIDLAFAISSKYGIEENHYMRDVELMLARSLSKA